MRLIRFGLYFWLDAAGYTAASPSATSPCVPGAAYSLARAQQSAYKRALIAACAATVPSPLADGKMAHRSLRER